MKVWIYLLALSASAQPFDATTNTIVTPVLGSTFTTTDGTNWTPVDALMIRFDVADTNDVAPQRRLRLPVVKAKLDSAVAKSKILAEYGNITNYGTPYTNYWVTNKPVSRVAQSFSENDTTSTWTVHCSKCGHAMNIAVKQQAVTVEEVK